ncbi:hypothetical protein EMGR_001239 [Emarellia grisea]
MAYSTGLPVLLPALPAAIRRRIPRLNFSLHQAMGSADRDRSDTATDGLVGPMRQADALRTLAPFSTSDLGYCRPPSSAASELGAEESRRPATAGSSVCPESYDSRSSASSSSGKTLEALDHDEGSEGDAMDRGSMLAKYEVESGLRWNRVIPAFSLLRNAGYEAQQSTCDGRFVRSLYINALGYLLDALPADLTDEESMTIQHNLPARVKVTLAASSAVQPGAEAAVTMANQGAGTRYPTERSYLHRLLASSIVQFFLIVQFLLPYVKILLQQVYRYERSHRITERLVTATLDAADSLGKGSVSLGSTVLRLNEGKVGTAFTNLAACASLKHATPSGIYMSITPGDPTLWSGVIFVRSGPYASAVLRFQLRFPDSYPELPPIVTFSTDVFHPLIVPLTTYTFSTGASTEDPVSATDEERLPPGGFSLRHGFPHWFGRARKTGRQSTGSSRPVSVNGRNAGEGETASTDGPSSPSSDQPTGAEGGQNLTKDKGTASDARKTVPVAVLLNYIRSTFDDENVLDSLPLEAAGNPSAWHAWKAHRRENSESATSNSKRGSPQARLPGDWHWDGIWAKRVQYEIEASHSDQMLFGNAARGATDEMIRFSRLDDSKLASIKEMIIPPIGEAHE